MELLNVIADLAIRNSRNHPEVSDSLYAESIVLKAVSNVSFTIDPDDIAEVCETIMGS